MRFYVQAYRSGHWDHWVTDKSFDAVVEALEHGHKLTEEHDRPVRVVDDEERMLWRSAETVTAFKRRTGKK